MTLRNRLRAWLYYWIDTADTWVLRHPGNPLARLIRKPVYGAWCWMMGRGTHTAVGDIQAELGVTVPCLWNSYGDPIDSMYFRRTHDENIICYQGCVIHNRTAHHMQFWPLHWRSDRRIFERICDHGCGHPDPDQGPYWKATDQDWQWLHGCDSCCRAGTVEVSAPLSTLTNKRLADGE